MGAYLIKVRCPVGSCGHICSDGAMKAHLRRVHGVMPKAVV